MPEKKKARGRPFQRGRSGNPKGRPKTAKALTDRLRSAIEANDGKRARAIINALLKKADGGDLDAIRVIFNRLEGAPTQRHEVEYVRREAERLAEKYGLDPDDVLREADTILKEQS